MSSAALVALGRAAQRVRMGGAGVPSPCLSVCQMQPTSGLCAGCLRTLDEIAAWGRLDDAAKRGVWLGIETRITALSSKTE